MTYKIYIDGSSRGNPGPGGFGLVILSEDERRIEYKYSKHCDNTTNNREELKALIQALEMIDEQNKSLYYNIEEPIDYIIYSDSSYVVNIWNDWLIKWANNNFLKSDNFPPENLDLIKTLFKYYTKKNK